MMKVAVQLATQVVAENQTLPSDFACFSDINYLEPKWPLFWLKRALFWRVDLQK